MVCLSVLLSCVGLAAERPATGSVGMAGRETVGLASTAFGTARLNAARFGVGRVSAGEIIDGGTRRAGAAGAGTDGKRRTTGVLRLGVPAYWAAGTVSGAAAFTELIAAAPTVDTVIVNGPASGPAVPYDRALARVIRRLSDRGVTVLGYVDTGYLGRTGQVTTRISAGSTAMEHWQAQATADANTWFDLYGAVGLGGVFFDQTLSDCGRNDEHLSAYGDISGAVWRRDSEAVVAINPGTSVEECYTRVANIIVIAENTMAAYRSWSPPAWAHSYPREMFWHLVHGVAATELDEALRLARQRNAGRVFVTNAIVNTTGGPWNVLPARPYWLSQVAAVRVTRSQCLPALPG